MSKKDAEGVRYARRSTDGKFSFHKFFEYFIPAMLAVIGALGVLVLQNTRDLHAFKDSRFTTTDGAAITISLLEALSELRSELQESEDEQRIWVEGQLGQVISRIQVLEQGRN